eukprot:1151976-Pelagomonas_calceolata.AAC.4
MEGLCTTHSGCWGREASAPADTMLAAVRGWTLEGVAWGAPSKGHRSKACPDSAATICRRGMWTAEQSGTLLEHGVWIVTASKGHKSKACADFSCHNLQARHVDSRAVRHLT